MADWTLVTGATGFIGGEWTLRALMRGEDVAVLVRPGREAAVTPHLQVLASAHGLGWPYTGRLAVMAWDGSDDGAAFARLRSMGVDRVGTVIHSAADMVYSLKKLPRSLENNLGLAVGLYGQVARHLPEARKFISVSTAYTCGMGQAGPIPEALHLTPKLVNGYQVSKWATEMALTQRARQGGPALTILRPSIVVGETGRGVYTGKCFGFYMFLRAFALARRAGARSLRISIHPDAEINLLPVDQLMALLDALRAAEKAPDVVHAALERGMPVGHMMGVIGRLYGMDISEGKPRTLPELFFNRQVAPNMAFANTTFRFGPENARSLVPLARWDALCPEALERVVEHSRQLYFKGERFNREDMLTFARMLPVFVRKSLRV